MWAPCAFLTFMAVAMALAAPEMVKLDLRSAPSKQFVKTTSEFDGVNYTLYKPGKNFSFKAVADGSESVWTASCEYDRAKFALVAREGNVPALLYLRTELYNYSDLYFVRAGGRWAEVTRERYTKKLNALKPKAKPAEFTLNLTAVESTEKFAYDPTNNFKKYDTFTPKRDFSATAVYHGVSNLWTAGAEGERALAAWAYKYHATHYLVRVLVANAEGALKFFNFFRVAEVWADLRDEAFSFLRAYDTSFPEDFVFPHFANAGPAEAAGARFGESLTSKSDFLDSSFTFVPESKREEHDFQYHMNPIPNERCKKLDFSRRLPRGLASLFKTVFGRRLEVLTYLPKAGTFFDTVADGPRMLYHRNVDSEACIGVHFYRRGKELYLADVLVTSPNNPRSEYHVRQAGRWTLVKKSQFLELLDEFKA